MACYYNENDAYPAQWLRNLIAAGHIASGEVDERSIVDVSADDLRGFTQCHFFAGIGVWSHALRIAGWSDSKRVWTGSCPCQPFSAAGKGEGYADERHLWPHWHRLIAECRPPTIFGEQVDAAVRTGWLDDVSLSLEQLGYAFGAVDFPACSVGAPHIRQRLYFVADAQCGAAERYGHALAGTARGTEGEAHERQRLRADARNGELAGKLADSDGGNASTEREQRSGGRRQDGCNASGHAATDGGPEASRDSRPSATSTGGLEQSGGVGRQRGETPAQRHDDDRQTPERPEGEHGTGVAGSYRGATNGFWLPCDWLPCIDGKARPVEPGTFPLAHGAAARVGRLRAYGNAINARQAAEFIHAFMSERP